MSAQPTTTRPTPPSDAELIAALRQKLESRQSYLLNRLGELGDDSGKLLYELRWLNAAEARAAYRSRRWWTWLGLLEAGVFVVFTSAALVFLAAIVGDMLGI